MKNYLPSTSSKKISTYENKEDITQEDTLRLTDEDEYVSAEAHKYMSLFDEIIEEKSCDDGDIEGENKDITDEKDSEEFAK
ncbi:unnamed protein product [Rhizophagus irregularis]|nr:unnamed protein product [Rhizophagus irregularis]